MKTSQDGNDVTGFGSVDNSTSKRVLDLLEVGYLRLCKVVIERMTVVKFGMNDRGGNGRSCFGIEVRADSSKLTNMVIAGFGNRRNLI